MLNNMRHVLEQIMNHVIYIYIYIYTCTRHVVQQHVQQHETCIIVDHESC
jgi:hypothetical protein